MSEQLKQALNAPFPRSAVATREQGGKKLSYTEGHYVIRTLNAIFGNAEWSYEVTTREVYRERTLDKLKNGGEVERWHVSYSASCKLTAGNATIVDVGHGHGIDRDCGLAIESAEKEAATDSLKRCAKSLGDALGLALYSKGQENVADEPAEPVKPPHTVEEVLTLFATTRSEAEHHEGRAMMGAIWVSATQAERDLMTKASRESFARTKGK